jgi:cytosine/adenosine deaminase-related metal-dependent hydrolase
MTVLDELGPGQVAHIRAANDRRFRGWNAKRVIRLHQLTLDETAAPDEYLDGIRRHLADGTYRRIYPPHVVEATRLFLAQVSSRKARA